MYLQIFRILIFFIFQFAVIERPAFAQRFPGDPYNFLDSLKGVKTIEVYEADNADTAVRLFEVMELDSQNNIIKESYCYKSEDTESLYDSLKNKIEEKDWNYGSRINSTMFCNHYENSKLTTITEINSARSRNFFYDTYGRLIHYENFIPGWTSNGKSIDRLFRGTLISWNKKWFGDDNIAFINFHYPKGKSPDTDILGYYYDGILDSTIITYSYRKMKTVRAATQIFSDGSSLKATFDAKGRLRTAMEKHKSYYDYDSQGRLKKITIVLRTRHETLKMMPVKLIPAVIKHFFAGDLRPLKRTDTFTFVYLNR